MVDSSKLGGFQFQVEEGVTPRPIKYIGGIEYEFIQKKYNTETGTSKSSIALKWKWSADKGIYGFWFELPPKITASLIKEYKALAMHMLFHWQEDMNRYIKSVPFGKAFLKYPKARKLLVKLHLV